MFFGIYLTDPILVIEILEVLLLVQSVALCIQSDSKVIKIVNALAAVLWFMCILYNILKFGFGG